MKNNKDVLRLIASSASHKDVSDLNVNIIDDLNMDSLDAISFLFEVENEFRVKIPEEDIDQLELFNLNKLYDYISKKTTLL
jgi:acyl carrier protein